MANLLARYEQLIDSGLALDAPGQKAPMWSDGQNVTFLPGYARPFLGAVVIGDTLQGVPVTGINMIRRSGAALGFIGCGSKILSFSNPTSSPYTVSGSGFSTSGDPWVIQPWGNWMVATNNVDAPQIDKSGTCANLDTDSVFSRCKGFVEASPYMFAYNTNASGDQGNGVFWCHQDDVETWLAAASNLAGDTEIRNTNSEITCGCKLGADIIMYTLEDMYRMQFVGAPFVWNLQHMPPNIGALGPHAVCEVGNMHYGIGPLGIWRTDGFQEEYMDLGWVRDYVFDDINLTYGKLAVAVHIKAESCVAFSYPSANSTYNDRTVVFNYAQKTWSKLGFGFTAAFASTVFNYVIAGLYTGVIARLGDQDVAFEVPTFGWGGTPVNVNHPSGYGWGEGGWGGYDDSAVESYATLQSKPLNLGTTANSKFVDSIVVEIKGTPSAGTLIYYGHCQSIEDAITWDSGQAFPSSNSPIYIGVDDFFHFVKIVDPNPTTKWKISALEFYGRVSGARR